ncbi:hypothetical protein AVEN_119260-1, partial [Araneus ventricosus]
MHFCHRSYKDVNTDYKSPFCHILQCHPCCTPSDLENRCPLNKFFIRLKSHMGQNQVASKDLVAFVSQNLQMFKDFNVFFFSECTPILKELFVYNTFAVEENSFSPHPSMPSLLYFFGTGKSLPFKQILHPRKKS